MRPLDQTTFMSKTLQLHQPSLDDVFLAKTGRKLEGASAAEVTEPTSPARGGRGAE